MTTAAELVVKVSADTSSAEGDLRSFSSRMLGGAGGMGAVFGGTLLTAGVMGVGRAVGGLAKGVVGLGASAVSAGSEFAYSMDQVAAVLGATNAEAEQLQQTAVGLGINPNLKVSTTEAAAAMYGLATAGLSTEQIIGGAAEATVLLANATGGDMTQAAHVATDAMALWGISADQMGESINGVTGVSNASKFDLNDYALALAQGGGVAAMAGVSFEDFNATIAATSSFFSSGSDAGTSLKTMLASLTPTTKAQKDAMFELGLLTEDGSNAFYDAEGNLRGMYDIVGLLNGATKDLTEEQRTLALQTIFGNDAMRSAGALAGMTADEYEAMYMVVNEGTSAMDQAKIRTDNLQSAWQTFGDTIDAAKTKIGLTLEVPLTMAVKALTPVVDMVSDFIQPYINEAAAWLTTNIPILQANIPFALTAWNNAPGLVSGLAAAFGELTGQTATLKPVIDDLTAMDAAINAFNKEGSVNAVGAMLLGLAAAVSGGTAAFDEATGTFTARWAAFQVELGKGGTVKVNVKWEMFFPETPTNGFSALNTYLFGSPHPLAGVVTVLVNWRAEFQRALGGDPDPFKTWAAQYVGKGKLIEVTPQVRVHPQVLLAPQEQDPVQAWLAQYIGKGKLIDFSPMVQVTPKYTSVGPMLNDLSAWLASKLNAGAAAIEAVITPVLDTQAWADQISLWFGPAGSVTVAVEGTFTWVSEKWKEAVTVPVSLAWAWVSETWKEAFTVDVSLAWEWVSEEWKEAVTVQVKLSARWISTAWQNAYSVIVNLIPNWLGGAPSAPPTGGAGGGGGGMGGQATGSVSAPGGLTWVGERGPELVALPGASRVWNNRESMAMAGAGGPQVVINAAVADALDIESLARRVGQYLARGA